MTEYEKTEAEIQEILKPLDHAEFARKVADKKFNYYVSFAGRHGFGALMALIEYRIFHPVMGPETNDDFLFHVVKLDELPFVVFGVPHRFEPQVAELADVILMRVAKAYPTLIGPDGPLFFPGHKEAETGRYNLFTIENTTGSQVYLNRPVLNKGLKEREAKIINILMGHGRKVPVEAIRDYLWFGMIPGESPV